ncbi:bolA-like protein 1 isoform X2 [Vidua macroura]|uniref:bolA-like protein 1 isoform X2 n=1 Tax=Vidua macroura TaxID=187451 RepID=UPI0023A83AD6|nr:bolA-like protein 1 isoform X2 [Vidua macroura]
MGSSVGLGGSLSPCTPKSPLSPCTPKSPPSLAALLRFRVLSGTGGVSLTLHSQIPPSVLHPFSGVSPSPMRGPLLAGAMGGAGGPLARTIRAKLTAALQPTHLEVRDDSPRHGGPPGAETHFGVLVVSGRFAGLPPLQRHRLVHEALRAELAGPLHALQVVARTPEQWQSDPQNPPAPPCLGGSKREKQKEEEEEKQ